MSCECEVEASSPGQRRVLWMLLSINAVMFLIEGTAGLIAHSTGLIADSLDMFADAAVYGVGLYAVGRSVTYKAKAAYLAGIVELMLGLGVAFEVIHHIIAGAVPESMLMMGFGALALVANLCCLAILSKHREGEIHMRASWIFSTNDVLANLGVIAAGALVAYFGSSVPDLIIGSVIAALVIRGGVLILKDARAELAKAA